MDLKQIVKEEASKHFTKQAEIDAFMEGFEKQAFAFPAGFGSSIMAEMPQAVANGAVKAGFGLAAGLLGVAAVKGINSAHSSITNNALKSKFEFALAQVKSTNKIVRGANPTKVDSYAQTLFNFAPNVASDVNLLDTLLTNAVHGEGVDASILKSVTDLEGRYKENNSATPLTGIRV